MSDKMPVASMIFVDRRKTGKGKSLPNRQKLLDRIRESVRKAKPDDIDASGIKGAVSSGKQLANPVKVARDALQEPSFRYAASTGEQDMVLPGNDRWLKGDEIPISGEGEGDGAGSGNGPGEDGEDDFIINISRSEFFDVFFDDCELPDLEQCAEKELPEAVRKPAGFAKEGTPGQLSVIRSYRNSLGRRRALTLDDREEIAALEEELLKVQEFLDGNVLSVSYNNRYKEITARIEELRTKIAAIPTFEKVDHRYRKSEKVMVKSADAVVIFCMDISGSVDEQMKRTARKFFSLQYAFIKRKYPNTDLVFIYHTDVAEEVSEEEFFTTRKNGGTIISPAIALAHKIIKERYDATTTNIYFSYAGDGDNWPSDNSAMIDEFETKGFLSKLRHSVYVQVGEEMRGYGGMTGQASTWNTMESISKTSKKVHTIKIRDEGEVFDAFKKIYRKKPKGFR
jgi:uncharacterized sporulation protein YeaH/YhbH (DUF444 family)